jgi:hypothetical protein
VRSSRGATLSLEAADLVAIDGLIATYLYAIGDLVSFAELWTEDARFDLAVDDVGLGTPLRGREAIVAAFEAYFARGGVEGPKEFTRHLAAQRRIDVSDGQVRAETGMFSVVQPRGVRSRDWCRVSRTGIYYDRFEREDGRWRFAERLLAWDPPGR